MTPIDAVSLAVIVSVISGIPGVWMLRKTIVAYPIRLTRFVRKNLPKMSKPTPIVDTAIGFVGGVLGGSTGLSGALPTMWCAMRPWPKEQTRAVTQPYNVSILIVAAALFAIQGVYDTDALAHIAIACPVTVLSAFVGMTIFRQLKDEQFRRLLIALLLFAGLILAVRELL